MVAAASWALAAIVMFGPGVSVSVFFWRRHKRRHRLRRRVAPYTHIPGRTA